MKHVTAILLTFSPLSIAQEGCTDRDTCTPSKFTKQGSCPAATVCGTARDDAVRTSVGDGSFCYCDDASLTKKDNCADYYGTCKTSDLFTCVESQCPSRKQKLARKRCRLMKCTSLADVQDKVTLKCLKEKCQGVGYHRGFRACLDSECAVRRWKINKVLTDDTRFNKDVDDSGNSGKCLKFMQDIGNDGHWVKWGHRRVYPKRCSDEGDSSARTLTDWISSFRQLGGSKRRLASFCRMRSLQFSKKCFIKGPPFELISNDDDDEEVVLADEACAAKNHGFNIPLKVASFNIKTFGNTKLNKPKVQSALKEIFEFYDLVAVQEFRDKNAQVPFDFLDKLNEGRPGRWAIEVSPQAGNAGSSFKELYAFIYRPEIVEIVKTFFEITDDDVFSRDPFAAHVKRIGSGESAYMQEFTYVTFHARAHRTAAEDEMNNMDEYFAKLINDEGYPSDIVLGGDLNADCTYMSVANLEALDMRQDTSFTWLIGDDEDTTSGSTTCAYDRFIFQGSNFLQSSCPAEDLTRVSSDVAIFDFTPVANRHDTTVASISDHFPISMNLY